MRRTVLSIALFAGCGDGADHPVSGNVIDKALYPRLVAAAAERVPAAGDHELCRRMFIDLVGSIPTVEELEQVCGDRTPGELADALMADPRFIALEQRLWVGELREDYNLIHASHLLDADRIIAELASGAIGYDDFVAAMLAHPAVAGSQMYAVEDAWGNERFFPDDVATNAMRAFLGRPPVGIEAADLGNLFRPWRFDYPVYPPVLPQDEVPFAMLDPSACDEVTGLDACTSTAFGEVVRVDLAAAGLDEAIRYDEFEGELPAPLRAELERPGRLLARQSELWDQAADRALSRFTGWWKASYAQPDTDLPEVRAALADWFRATAAHDVRALYRMVLTSRLYVTTAAVAPEVTGDPPPWTRGPTKPMTAEVYLDSVATALDLELGFCDIHTDEEPYLDETEAFYPPDLREPDPPDLVMIEGEAFSYYLVAWDLGGCRGPRARTGYAPSMTALSTHELLGKSLCGAALAEVSGDEDVDEIATGLFERFLGRAPEPAERAVIEEGDRDPRTAFYEICGALLRSSEFLYY